MTFWIYGISLFVLALGINLFIDYKQLLNKGKIDHRSKWPWIRKALICMPSVIAFSIQLWEDVRWIPCLVVSSAMVAFVFWLLFDIFLNILRGEKWYYAGTKDMYDSATEKLQHKLDTWGIMALKVVPAGALIYLYIQFL